MQIFSDSRFPWRGRTEGREVEYTHALFVSTSNIFRHESHDLQYVCSLKAALDNLKGVKI